MCSWNGVFSISPASFGGMLPTLAMAYGGRDRNFCFFGCRGNRPFSEGSLRRLMERQALQLRSLAGILPVIERVSPVPILICSEICRCPAGRSRSLGCNDDLARATRFRGSKNQTTRRAW